MKIKIKLIILFFTINFCAYSQTAEEWFYKGVEKANKKDFEGAILSYNKSIALEPNVIGVYAYRGLAKLNLNDFEGAKSDANKAIKLGPQYPDAYVLRGKARNNLGDKNGACLDWNKALKLGFKDATIFINKYCK
jgi:tetratricopeptide (TPR) repeat protein